MSKLISSTKIITPELLAASGTEHGEQAALFCHAVGAAKTDYRWGLMFAIPNGGERGAATAARLKAEGVKAGVPDVLLPVARGGFFGLFIEMKKAKKLGSRGQLVGGGSTQIEQDNWHKKLLREGYAVAVCYGWIEAVVCINEYFGLRITPLPR